ncbi:MAG: TldD/PmbA family protein [Erysipelotrichales bacterium]|nr:TldD/PmbA family protein [Erysipelotrichales bacterium]
MKAPFSPYLDSISFKMKELVRFLRKDYDYVSVLSTDSKGFTVSVSPKNKSITNENLTTERGNVVRVYKNGLYSEYAFNDFDEKHMDELANQIRKELDRQLEMLGGTGTKVYNTKKMTDEPLELFVEKETEVLPERADMNYLVQLFTDLTDECMIRSEHAVQCAIRAQSTHISKMFISGARYLRQSYVYSEANMTLVTANEKGPRFVYEGVSGCKGPEVFEELRALPEKVAELGEKMLEAEPIVPGEYEIITDPGVTGLIAHEAFGHGVEMDMFVKNRALGKEYLNKRVGSDLVTMHEGAKCAESVTAFVFDDEGTLAGDVTEIDHGILKTGIADALSALRLGIEPTGNGKRQNFEHKVYTRMTNTIFDAGEDTLEDMIASVKYGYLLEGMESGMEDPKHWGIQCIIARGYEISDGKLTGKIAAPVVMTGYVPDLLGNITMASKACRVDGNGACGKGYKEFVKVADGGPYLKTKARLG